MQPTSVFASALSRLHADLILVRLKRGGIGSDKISAIFPERLQPNSTLCWLEGLSTRLDSGGERITVAGPLRKVVRTETEALFVRSLHRIGIDEQHASSLANRLSRDEILICVQTTNEAEISIAWHTYRELEAECLAVGAAQSRDRKESWLSAAADLQLSAAAV